MNLVLLRIVSGDELIGMLKKRYTDGSLIVSNVMEVFESEQGIMLRPYLISPQVDLTINFHAIIAHAEPTEDLSNIYISAEKYWPENAFKAPVEVSEELKSKLN